MREIPIDDRCVRCGFKLLWKVLLGKRPTARLESFALCLLTVLVASYLTLFSLSVSATASHKPGPKWHLITRVVDGDTIIIDGRESVSLIGVDTPETKHPQRPVEYFGREATAFTRKMAGGKRIRLEFDRANMQIAHKDRHKRTLANLFLEDGIFLNAEIIKQGFGFAYARFPFRYLNEFRRLEREAGEESRGLWGNTKANPAKFTLTWTDNSNNEDGFKIERETGTSEAFTQIAAVRANVTSYNDSGLTSGTTYCYRVRAFNASGTSGYTAEACRTAKHKSVSLSKLIIGSYKVRRLTFVYSQPKEDSRVVSTIRPGTKVHVVDVEGDWLEIRSKHGRPPGFIKRDSATPMGGP